MLTTFPMNGEDDITDIIVNIDDNVSDQRSEKLLACAHCYIRGIPGCRQVLR
jgi:hypothetical protein